MLWLSLRGADWRKSKDEKKRRKKRPKWEKEAMGWGGRGRGITDGGELRKTWLPLRRRVRSDKDNV